MSSESNLSVPEKEHPEEPSAAKKEAAKLEKQRRRLEAAASSTASSSQLSSSTPPPPSADAEDPLASNYGDVPLVELQSKEVKDRNDWTRVEELDRRLEGKEVLIRGRVQTVRTVGKGRAFVVLRGKKGCTVQCVVDAETADGVSRGMVKFVAAISRESIVDITGPVTVPPTRIKGTTQEEIELRVTKIYCISRGQATLPFEIEDASRSKKDIEDALKAGGKKPGKQPGRVNQDTRLNQRFFDIRTAANQGIFHIQSHISNAFRQFLLSERFIEIHTPKLIAGSSEGGSAVFTLDYKGQPACLAQSPQLHKQMAICGDMDRVFEIGPVFRAEDSYTHRHLCEFTGLDVEMEIMAHYSEVMDVVDRLFISIFDSLNETCGKELAAVERQYPFQPLKYLKKTLRLKFEEGIQMLKEAGVEVDPFGDLSTEVERKLGQLVLEKYGTEFYILHRYPLAVRPFYTMPCHDDPRYSNSFDAFIRGEEIISGAQRIHEPDLLKVRAKACGPDPDTISAYIDSFRNGAPLHGGFGVGLERVVMLFCGLNNIRKTSLFPRDPVRLAP